MSRRSRRTIIVALALLAAVAVAHAQGRFVNATTETRSAAQGLEREMRAVAARRGVTWAGYRVAMTAGPRQMCCYDSVDASSGGCCGRCRLETGSGVTMTTGAAAGGSRIVLEPPSEFLVLARFEGGSLTRIRTFTPDCDVDAGGTAVVWLTDVKPDDSIAWLTAAVSGAAADREATNRVADPALAALTLHQSPRAVEPLVSFAKSSPVTRVRSQALFWLSQRAGREAVATIANAIDNDPETEVKRRAVFALSQLPKDEGIPKLIEVARTNRNPEVRKQAFFWLGQSKDPRALALFEEILLKK